LSPQPFPQVKQSHLLVAVGILIIVAIIRSNSANVSATTETHNWNTKVIDATKNGNAIITLILPTM